MGRWHSQDLLAEKYYEWTPYNYVGGNPVKRIDLFGLDWYTDKDGTYQYDPKINRKSKLQEGQSYAFAYKQFKNAAGKITEDYRKDGSILFSDETKAYDRIWNQAHEHYKDQKEVGGFILKDESVLVLPDYANERGKTKYEDYGYSIGNGIAMDKEKNKFEITGFVHTHQDKSRDATPSIFYDMDLGLSIKMGNLPVTALGWDNKVSTIYYSPKLKGYNWITNSPNNRDEFIKAKGWAYWLVNEFPKLK